MDALQTELAHLVALMAPPYRDAWRQYCWAKANVLAEGNPTEYGELPKLLAREMRSKDTSTPTTSAAE